MGEISKVYVGNLNYDLAEDELKKAFEEKGLQVKSVQIIKDKYSGRSKGFGFIELESEDAIEKAIEALDGQDLKGRNLKISKAKKPTGGFNKERK
jgi:RNA recognition motif-containing protein